jgi:hypothetical protein
MTDRCDEKFLQNIKVIGQIKIDFKELPKHLKGRR